MSLFEFDHDMQSTIGMLVFWLVVFCLAASTKPKTYRRIAVGECLKPSKKLKVNDGDIMRGGEYVE